MVGRVRTRVRLGVPEHSGVVDHDRDSPRRERREVRRAQDQGRVRGLRRQDELLPGVPGAVGESARGADHPIALRTQLGQPQGHLAREALDAADLSADCRASVDRDHERGYCRSRRRRIRTPAPASAIPRPPPSHASNPVIGRLDPDPDPDDEVELDVADELAIVDVLELVLELDDATGVLELVVGVDDPELELEPLEDPDEELDDDDEPELFFDDASGSVYC
jgi:hypothetical protein